LALTLLAKNEVDVIDANIAYHLGAGVDFVVAAEARSGAQGRRATLSGSDPYGLTARLVVTAVIALRDGEIAATGALAPAEAFEPTQLVERLAPYLRVESVGSL